MHPNKPKQPTLYSVTASLRATVERTSAAVSLNIFSCFPWQLDIRKHRFEVWSVGELKERRGWNDR